MDFMNLSYVKSRMTNVHNKLVDFSFKFAEMNYWKKWNHFPFNFATYILFTTENFPRAGEISREGTPQIPHCNG